MIDSGYPATGKNGSGGVGKAIYKTDSLNNATEASVALWCRSEHKIAGAGAWRKIKITGTISRVIRPDEILRIARECGAK